jgi:hypothetical protein
MPVDSEYQEGPRFAAPELASATPQQLLRTSSPAEFPSPRRSLPAGQDYDAGQYRLGASNRLAPARAFDVSPTRAQSKPTR